MRFLRSGGTAKDAPGSSTGSQQENNQFFITENILDSHPMGDSKIIHEERSQQESEMEAVQEGGDEGEEEEEENEEEMDANFDFGRAKMDYFKQRAKDILMNETDLEYEGHAM